MKFEVVTVVNMQITISLDVTPWNLVDKYQCFGETYCLHLQHIRINHPGKDNEKTVCGYTTGRIRAQANSKIIEVM
jgi:hypothetical protein